MDQDPTPNDMAPSTPPAGGPPIVDAVPVSTTGAPAPSAGAGRGRGGRLLNIALAVAVVAAIGGVAFAAGRMTAPTVTAGSFPGGGNFPGGNFGPRGSFAPGAGDFRGGGLGGATIEGTVESIAGDTMTIKTAGGQTIQVALNGSTTYHSQTDATANDIAPGGKVLVRLSFGGGGAAAGGTGSASASDVTVVP